MTTIPTLTELLELANLAKESTDENMKSIQLLFNEITYVINSMSDLFIEYADDPYAKYDLLQYKSSLLNIKSKINSALEQATTDLGKLNTIIENLKKAIQLKTGDIF